MELLITILFVLFSLTGLILVMKDYPGGIVIILSVLIYSYFLPLKIINWEIYIVMILLFAVSEFLDVFSLTLAQKKKVKLVKLFLNLSILVLFIIYVHCF